MARASADVSRSRPRASSAASAIMAPSSGVVRATAGMGQVAAVAMPTEPGEPPNAPRRVVCTEQVQPRASAPVRRAPALSAVTALSVEGHGSKPSTRGTRSPPDADYHS